MTAKSMARAWTKAQLVFQVCTVVALTVLDVRDLNYKTNWLGPYISYRFAAVGANVLQPVNLQLAVNMTTSGMLLHRPNGWSSFFEKCENLSPVAHAKTFRSLVGHNCTVGTQDHNVTYTQLIMAGSVRVDSVAWACCQLLEPNRHPPVCNSNLVRDFEERYFMELVPVPGTWVAEAGSVEKAELLGLLDVIGISTPLSQMTCVEGFEYLGPGQYYLQVLGCGAPNYFRSAFAGHYATKLRELHYDKAYLTVDNINLMGFHFKIRENCVSDFKVTYQEEATTSGTLGITHTTTINFSSYGQLYALMSVIDVVLMVLNLMGAIQLAANLVVPAFQSKAKHADENFAREGYATFLTSSLYRSPIVMALLIVSQLSSWFMTIPNAVMWTWGNSSAAKIQAYLSSVRTWTLILIVVNNAWDLFVFLHEKLAFQVAQHTFLMSVEIIAIGAYVSYYNRAKMFAIADTKYNVERQRNSDATSFKGYTGACNAFNGDLDHQLNTPTEVLWIIYKPLFTILLYSVVAIFLYVVVKFVVIFSTPSLARHVFKKELFVTTTADAGKYAVSSRDADDDLGIAEDTSNNSNTSISRQACSNRQISSSARSFGTTHLSRFGLAENSITENAVTAPALPVSSKKKIKRGRGYARLPLEELINTPIRARSLVRPTFSLNHVVNHKKFVSVQLYLEFGVFFVDGRMKPRWGFLNPVPSVIQVSNTVISDMIEPPTPAEQLSKLRPATSAKK